jgi:hypothetical protein
MVWNTTLEQCMGAPSLQWVARIHEHCSREYYMHMVREFPLQSGLFIGSPLLNMFWQAGNGGFFKESMSLSMIQIWSRLIQEKLWIMYKMCLINGGIKRNRRRCNCILIFCLSSGIQFWRMRTMEAQNIRQDRFQLYSIRSQW